MSSKKPQDAADNEIEKTAAEAPAQEEEKKPEKGAKSAKKDKEPDLLEAMTKEAHKLAVELAEEKDKLIRLAAEYDNFRKRSQKERENIYTDVRADTLIKILPVYDNLERALKQETADEAYRKGVEMTMTQLRDIMASLGVTEIDAKPGDKFDPDIHNAVMHVEDETQGEGVVVEEFQKGFRLGDKVIRFSVVKVAN